MKCKMLFAALLFVSCTGPSIALDCVLIRDPGARLACYDKEAERTRDIKEWKILMLFQMREAVGQCGFEFNIPLMRQFLFTNDVTLNDAFLSRRSAKLQRDIDIIGDEFMDNKANACEKAWLSYGPNSQNKWKVLKKSLP